MSLYLGLDIGSTSVKALLKDEKGVTVAVGRCAYPTSYAPGGVVTQDARDWWSASVKAVREASAGREKDIAAMGISSQGGSILAATDEGEPLNAASSWMDATAVNEAEEIRNTLGAETVYRTCGWGMTPSAAAAKLLHMRRREPEIFRRAGVFLTTQEYIMKKLTGFFVTDPASASIARLFDIEKGKYNDDMLCFLGMSEKRLPTISPAGEFIGTLTGSAAEELGLPEGVKVMNGTHDQYCASLGAGVTESGELLIASGTAWVLFSVTGRPLFTSSHISPCLHPAGGYGAMASLGGIGSEVTRFASAKGDLPTELDSAAKKVIPDRAVCPCPRGKGFLPRDEAFDLLSEKEKANPTDRVKTWRALLEGAAFEARRGAKEFKLPKGFKITMSGGAVYSRLWVRIVSETFGRAISVTKEPDAPALGAAMLAAVGDRAFESLKESAKTFSSREELLPPSPDAVFAMNERFNDYLKRSGKNENDLSEDQYNINR